MLIKLVLSRWLEKFFFFKLLFYAAARFILKHTNTHSHSLPPLTACSFHQYIIISFCIKIFTIIFLWNPQQSQFRGWMSTYYNILHANRTISPDLLKLRILLKKMFFNCVSLPQVPWAAIEGLVPPVAAVHPAERRAHLQDQWDVHQRH